MTEKGFNSTNLRVIFICLMVIISIGLVGGYYYAQDWLLNYAKDVNKTSLELAEKENSQTETGLASSMDRLKPAIDKSSKFTLETSTYIDNVKTDINKYASSTGLEITEISPTQFTATQTSPAITGLQKQYVSVTVKNPVVFTNLIKFIKAIETNIPKMRLTGIKLNHAPGDTDKISVDPLIVEVYTR